VEARGSLTAIENVSYRLEAPVALIGKILWIRSRDVFFCTQRLVDAVYCLQVPVVLFCCCFIHSLFLHFIQENLAQTVLGLILIRKMSLSNLG